MAKIFIGRPGKGQKSFETDVADSLCSRAMGIMWQGTPFRKPFDRPLFFAFEREATSSNSTHSLFCFVPYDAVFVDSGWKVTEVMAAIPGWLFWIVPKRPFRYLIEMPAGWAKKYGLKQGTSIALRQ
jgi:uncharacterized membrane protein (UPF0127 family)